MCESKVKGQRSKAVTRGRPGAVALITIVVFTAVLVVIGLAVSSIGQNEIVLSGVYRDGENAFSIADACAEDALMRLKSDQTFTGTTLPLDGGFCVSTVTHLLGDSYRILAEGSYIENIRGIEADVTLHFNGQGLAKTVLIDSWKEAD